MSLRIDSAEWISGALIIGETGLGVLGSAIPSTGDNGPGYTYNDLDLPTDATKEICGRITTWPTLGTLYAYEDTSFEYTGATDSFQYQLYVDGVAAGSPVTVDLFVGVTNAAATGSLPQIALSAPIGTATGTSLGGAVGIGAIASIYLSAPQGTAIGTATGDGFATGVLKAISLSSPKGTAYGTGLYVNAPSGSGYRREMSNTTRPPVSGSERPKQQNTTRH